jgi:hypothetical protein
MWLRKLTLCAKSELYLIFLIIILISILLGLAESQPGTYPVIPRYVSEESGKFYANALDESSLPSSGAKVENKLVIYNGDSAISTGAEKKVNYYKYQKSKFSENKKIVTIYFELVNKGDELNDIFIKEKVDPHLPINNFYDFPQIYDPFSDSSGGFLKEANQSLLNESIDKWNNSYSIDFKKNLIFLDITKLRPKERIRYSYKVLPNETGIFDSLTTVRIGGNYTDYEDYDYPLKITWEPPIIDVTPIKDASNAFIGKPLNLTYNMIYRTDSTSDPIKYNLSFNVPSNDEYSIFENETKYSGEQIEKLFYPLAYSNITIKIVYNQGGFQSLPEIMIEGIPTKIGSQIEVYPHWYVKVAEDNIHFISALGIIIAIITSIVSLYFFRGTKNGTNSKSSSNAPKSIEPILALNGSNNNKKTKQKNNQIYICKYCGGKGEEDANKLEQWIPSLSKD